MFQIGKTLISENLIENNFVCNLNACKGACCVEGESGAPLEEEETKILANIFDKVRPFLAQKGIKAIEEQGTFIKGEDGEWETPLVANKECAYTIFSKNGTAKCGIQEAYNQGAVQWKKPISCHMYPVRVRTYSEFTAVNYHKWEICDPACSLGEELQMPVYKFIKDSLIKKFGEAWYKELEQVAEEHTK